MLFAAVGVVIFFGPMKRVLFLCSQPFIEWRGSPIRVKFDVTALAEAGWDVDLLTLPMGSCDAIDGVNVIRVPNLFRARRISIGPSLLKAAFDVLILFRAVGLVLSRRYAVVHTVEDTGLIGVVAAWLGRARLVFEKHSDPSSYCGRPLRNAIMWLYAKVERFVIRHADAVIGTGPGLTGQMKATKTRAAICQIPDTPSSLVEADPARTGALRRQLQVDARTILVTYAGSFAAYQGMDLLFEAIPKVAAACPCVRFVIIGGSEAEIAARTERLRREGAERAVTWVGHVPPDVLPDYLAASDILLSPRLSGVNTPLKLLDYLKAGRAIVATDTPANRLILDETVAQLASPDPESFAAAIRELAESAERRQEIAAKGAERIRALHSFSEFKRRLTACYQALMAL